MKAISKLTRASAKHRAAVLAVTAIALLILGGGITQLKFSDNPLDTLPIGNPHAEAAKEMQSQFPGASYATAVFVSVNPGKWDVANEQLPNRVKFNDDMQGGQEELFGTLNPILNNLTQGQMKGLANGIPGANNITDEVYQRGMEEMWEYLQKELPEIRWAITLPSQVKLVNYTNSGLSPAAPLQDEAFALPGTDPIGAQQFTSNWQSYYMVSPDSVKTIVSLDWQTTRLGLLWQPGDQTYDEVGAKFLVALESYKDEIRSCDNGDQCNLQWNVFAPDDIVPDTRSAIIAAEYLTRASMEDILKLAPFAAGFIILCLALAFRRVSTISALLIPMGFAGVGVLGIFGIIGLPIHSISLLVFPVLMGNGIDFAIHMATAYHKARQDGLSTIDAAGKAGEAAGVPLTIATITTLAGMALLVFAPNRLLSQLGMAITLGMAILLLVSLTALPAALTWTKSPAKKTGALARALMSNAKFWNRQRPIGIAVLVVLVAGALIAAPQLQLFIAGTPASYFPEDDPHRADYENSNDRYYKGNEDLVSNALVFKGNLATPEAMDYLQRLQGELQALDFVRPESTVTPHFMLNAWIQVRNGTAGAPVVIAQETAQPGSTFPDTEEGIRFLMDEMFATPLATYASFFTVYPDYELSIALVEIYQAEEFDELEYQWNTILATAERVKSEGEDPGLEVYLAGGTAVAYLFTKEEMPYLNVAAAIGLVATGLLVLIVRRNWRDAATVTGVVGVSGLIWIGTLVILDIPMSIALVIPLVLIAAIGSDYALHLRYAIQHDGVQAWGVVGRAVVYSAITDLGAFLIFAFARYGVLADATIATAAALFSCGVTTLILVPVFSRRSELQDSAPQITTKTTTRPIQ